MKCLKGSRFLAGPPQDARNSLGLVAESAPASAAGAEGAPRHLNWGMDTRHCEPGTREADGDLSAPAPLCQHPGKPAARALGWRNPHPPHPCVHLAALLLCIQSLIVRSLACPFWLCSLSSTSSPIQVSAVVASASSEGPCASLRGTANQNGGLVILGTPLSVITLPALLLPWEVLASPSRH